MTALVPKAPAQLARTKPVERLSPDQVRVIEFVAKGALVTLDQIVDRFIRTENETLLDARPRAEAMLKRLVVRGYLNTRPVVVDGALSVATQDPTRLLRNHYWTRAFNITPRTSWEFQLALPPTMRENFITHHVKTMDAALVVERQLRAEGYDVRSFKTEAELIRESFHGRVFNARTKQIVPDFPDLRFEVRALDGAIQHVNVEYVSRKYTDDMIKEKGRGFSDRTFWAAPANSDSTAARVRAITGQDPILV